MFALITHTPPIHPFPSQLHRPSVCHVPTQVLAISRVMVAWQPVGIAMGVYDMALRYLGEREQFGTPLSGFQISQEKLARMLGHIQVCVRRCFVVRT